MVVIVLVIIMAHLHGLQHGRFLASHITTIAIKYFDIQIESGAQNIFTQEPSGSGLFLRPLKDGFLFCKFVVEVNIRLFGAHGMRGNQTPF